MNFHVLFGFHEWKRETKEHFKKFNLRLNWDGPSFEQVLRFSPKFFSARTADAKRARRLLSWSSKTVTIKCYFLDYSNLEQIIKKILKSYIDLKNLITQCLNLFFKCGFCDFSQFNLIKWRLSTNCMINLMKFWLFMSLLLTILNLRHLGFWFFLHQYPLLIKLSGVNCGKLLWIKFSGPKNSFRRPFWGQIPLPCVHRSLLSFGILILVSKL